jgi:UDPglucose 6-dehydrogenase
MRDSPAIAVVRTLQDAGAKVRAFDPEGMEQAKLVLENVTYCDGPYDAMEGADGLAIVTEWDAFRALDFERLKETMAEPVLVDLRNIYEPRDVSRQGFRYFGVGRPAADRNTTADTGR